MAMACGAFAVTPAREGASAALQETDAAEPRILAVDSESFRGKLAALNASSVTFQSERQKRELALDDFLMWGAIVEPPAFSRITANESVRFVLAGGGFFTADLMSADVDAVVVESLAIGSREIPLTQIAAILLPPPTDAERADELIAGLLKDRPSADQAMLSNGDAVQGTLTEIDIKGAETVFSMETDSGKLPLEIANVRAITFDPRMLNARREPEQFRICLTDGSMLHVDELSITNGKAKFSPFVGATWEVSLERVAYVDYANPRVQWLEARQPDQYQHVPFLSGQWQWQPGKNVLGQALKAQGQRYAHGVGTHSACQVVYVLREPMERFEAEIAIDDAGQLGNAVFRVVTYARQDGQTVRSEKFASSAVRAGDAPLQVSVDLQGAVGLGLIVEFGEFGDQQDYANWLNARLIKSQE